MGNSLAKDFNGVKLGHGSLPDKLRADMLAPGSALLKKSKTVLVQHDHHRKSIIIFDLSSMKPLYITKVKNKKGIRSVTKDPNGTALYLTSQSKRPTLIYRVPEQAGKPSTAAQDSDFLNLELDDASRHTVSNNFDLPHKDQDTATAATATTSTKKPTKPRPMSDLPVAAQIEVDSSQAAPVGFFSVVVWGGSGPKDAVPVYKSIRIPQVKFGSLVVDMKGQVVGKSFLDEKRMEPIVKIAAGADVASVVEIASAVIGGF